ncbi:MAG: hypothetical protein NC204_05755 [Candidatus Amulumruptor caecigallinarius]|nr:hypothetical protein [Candidatus Amulumruptor caecigallinarius]
MEWTTIITTVLSGLFGLTTIAGFFLYPRALKREKTAEARLKEVEAADKEDERLDKRLANLHEDIDTLNRQLSEAYKGRARCEEIIADKTRLIRELQDEKSNLLKETGRKDLIIQWLKWWHCGRPKGDPKCDPESCGRRKPQQPFAIPYDPPDELKSDKWLSGRAEA